MGRHSADAPEPPSGHEPEGHSADFDDYQTSSTRRIAAPPPPGHRRRAALAVGIALLGVILLVFGVITLAQTDDPGTTSSQGDSATQTTASTAQTPSSTVPSSDPVTSSASQEMLPVTVLNNSPGLTPGLATNVADALEAGGWPIAELMNYSETQLSATTVFFTPGNAAEEAAAQALVVQFPGIAGGAEPRFEGLVGAGLTVAAVGDWVPEP